jgi:tRNA pseudouridine38-40 synthase
MKIALKFAYNGQNFFGYARQPNLRTVEGEILDILEKNNLINDLKKSAFQSASRTDKGVSALGNVVAFYTNFFEKKFLKILNQTHNKILFYGFKHVEDSFNPRYANLRQYRYYLDLNNHNINKIINGFHHFTGKHNFSNFARVESGKNPIRSIDNIIISEFNNFLIVDFFAQNFLWNQIRRIISAIDRLSMDKISDKDIVKALDHPEKIVDFGLASPNPLILKDILYDFDFVYDKSFLSKLLFFERTVYKVC